MPSIDLVISSAVSGTLQTVTTQDGSPSGLALANNATTITGQDIVGGALPLVITGQTPGTQPTWGRILRLAHGAGLFDFGIDASGNFFINSNASTATSHVLTISPSGQVTIPNLVLSNLQTAPGGSIDLSVDATGTVYRQ
jgi:hypothetical protein